MKHLGEGRLGGIVLPDYIEVETGRMRYDVSVGTMLEGRPKLLGTFATKEQTKALLKAAQQVVFLPHFPVSDRIFYGEGGHVEANEGYPTLRSGGVMGPDFQLIISNNFNEKHTFLDLFIPSEGDGYSAWPKPDNLDVDAGLASWLTEAVLIPVRDELMLTPVER